MQQSPEVIFMQVAIIFFILEGVCFPLSTKKKINSDYP